MKILVVGASRGTGALVAEEALRLGHEVTAFSRNPDRQGAAHPELKRIAGDFHDRASAVTAVAGHDAVIVTASASSLKGFKENPRYFSQGTENVIEAMKQAGAKRLVVLSALGVGDSRPQAGFLVDMLIIRGLLRRPFEDHERQEALVRESGLDWVIARPSRLTDGPSSGKTVRRLAPEKVPTSISRTDVAAFLVEAAKTDEWVGKAVQIGG